MRRKWENFHGRTFNCYVNFMQIFQKASIFVLKRDLLIILRFLELQITSPWEFLEILSFECMKN